MKKIEIKRPLSIFIQGAAGCGKSFFVKKNLYKRFFEHTDIAISVVFHKKNFIKEFKKKTFLKLYFLDIIDIEEFVKNNFRVNRWRKTLVVCQLDPINFDNNSKLFDCLDTIIKHPELPKNSLIYIDEPTYINEVTLKNIVEQFRKKIFCSQAFWGNGLNEDFVKINFSTILYGFSFHKKGVENLKRGEFIQLN